MKSQASKALLNKVDCQIDIDKKTWCLS